MQRRCIDFSTQGLLVRGTQHVEHQPSSGKTPGVGFLLFNTGPTPRAGDANISVRVSDRLAALGYPAFRVDLPGLGDSQGTRPTHDVQLFGFVERGGYTDVIQDTLKELRQFCDAEKFVIGGICGGAIASVFAASQSLERIAGLILLETEFIMRQPEEAPKSGAQTRHLVRAKKRLKLAALSGDSWRRILSGQANYMGHLRDLVGIAALAGKGVRSQYLPPDCNRPLVNHWSALLAAGLPSVVMNAEGSPTDAMFRQLKRRVRQRHLGALRDFSVPNSNHEFTSPDASDLVIEFIVDWAQERFPIAG